VNAIAFSGGSDLQRALEAVLGPRRLTVSNSKRVQHHGQARWDDDLDPLRDDPRYEKMEKRWKAEAKKKDKHDDDHDWDWDDDDDEDDT